MFDIKDKIVLITGAAAGIGASVVRTLLDEEIRHVSILDIDVQNGFAVEEELNSKYGRNKVKFIKCDITQNNELLYAFKIVKDEQGYIDVVINNAGIASDRFFVREIEVNLTALVTSTLQAWDLMRKDEGGRGGTVINVASLAAVGCFPAFPIYSATKTAVLKFSTLMGDELHYSRTGIRVVTVCFGATDTQLLSNDKLVSFDPAIDKMATIMVAGLTCQTTEQAAEGLTEVYKKGKSGSVWIVSRGKPAMDVTDKYMQTTETFNAIILN